MSDPRTEYWRALADTQDGLDRRAFVRLLGACLALAGLEGCVRRPREPILPYVGRPAEPLTTESRHYATSMTLDGYATGLLVESHGGRPTKVEGNPDHPASLGAAGVFEQASLLGLYDPQRARTVRDRGGRSSWGALGSALSGDALGRSVGTRGAGLHLLLEPTASPFVLGLVARVRERWPECRVHWDAPLVNDEARVGALAVFGRPAQPVYDLTAARVLLAIDADLLGAVPFGLRYAHDYARGRRITSPDEGLSRLYVVETAPSVTGGAADHRLRARPSAIPALVRVLAARVADRAGVPAPTPPDDLPDDLGRWTNAVAADLLAHRGSCAIAVGDRQPAEVHALVHWLNLTLDNDGRTVRYIEPPIAAAEAGTGLPALAEAMGAGQVACLAILEGNPIYTAAPALDLPGMLRRTPLTLYLGLYRNETARACRWFVPGQHYLETWGDGRAWDGTLSTIQPLVDPIFGGHSPAELLAALAGAEGDPRSLLQSDWKSRRGAGPPWEEAVQRGAVEGSAAPSIAMRLTADAAPAISMLRPSAPAAPGMELSLVPSAAVHDGRFGNNPWLQELPDPVSKLTWGNAAWISPATAARLGLDAGRMVEIAAGERRITLPALPVPGHADDSVTVALGYGRPEAGSDEGLEQVAAGVGASGYALARSGPQRRTLPVTVRLLPDRVDLPITQEHWRMEGRAIALHATLAEFRRRPEMSPTSKARPLSLYQPDHPPAEQQWAMVVDLSACTGCSACVVACQAENNVPVVGAEGVRKSREMHWLRLDRYYAGSEADPVVLSQPMLCQHCEKAPCEYVCPVAATVHSPDGLNEMVYNRCVGTRFCSNNCPYKVRRFNWFDYNAEVSATERLAKNPDVTVRARGVMEKCTFCVQRIREAEIAARVGDRPLGPAEVRTACQQSCPTRAIAFGSLTEPESEVATLWQHPRGYAVLDQLGTEPRVRYLARITNPNPELAAGAG
jgi:molybdopterin-containing oxidoreductase family iron-sulfur binding subunit